MSLCPAFDRLTLGFSLLLSVASCSTPGPVMPQVRGALAHGAVASTPISQPAPDSRGPRARTGPAQTRLLPVGVRDLPDGDVMLLFPLRLREPTFEVLDVDQVRPLLTRFASLPPLQSGPRLRMLEAPTSSRSGHGLASGELQLRTEFLSLYGTSSLPVPESLEASRLFLALRMSPRFMGEGFREAAIELFTSPVFVASVCLSVLLYFSAWVIPEPFFSKAFAATLTVRLSLLVGLAEVARVADACLRLYRESEAARSPVELEAAAERFGKAIGGTGLRVLVAVASLGLGRLAPDIPESGLQAMLGSGHLVGAGGPAIGAVATAKVVTDGTLIVTGVVTGTAVSSACGGLGFCAKATSPGSAPTGGAPLSTQYGPPHTRSNPQHNETIEQSLSAREAAGHTDLLKNKAQVDAAGKRVFEHHPGKGVRFRRPDASSVRPDGVRHNINYVSNPREVQREMEAFKSMVKADDKAIHELYLLDGTLIARHVPAGVSFP